MTDFIEGRRARRVRTLLLPMVMAAGALVAWLIVLNDLNGAPTDYVALDPASFEEIEFLALADQSAAPALRTALTRACDLNGCEADVLHPMILASTARMTPTELEAALDAQGRAQSESLAIRNRTLPSSDEARMAEMEIRAAEQIAALYEAELAER
ncbi:hypothetical protein SAMN05444004_10279 [Jannaschia faecimaris]|uniref:Uncharacterized protein n=1 Tax=Jannaschia faecimaris TaxID=1244108 RepID=A0A1H3L5J7_9RHOB|nr:hypothetical protein [Jannaschia faecimaris]SDY59145.1 hypothetical protein SAMN05444004_10279 [Jannaschia faecimaris]